MAVKITRDSADARRHVWVEAPIGLTVDGVARSARAWSVGGVALETGCDLDVVGSTHAVRVGVSLHGIEMVFTTAAVVESDPMDAGGGPVLRFTDLTSPHRDLLAAVIDDFAGPAELKAETGFTAFGTDLTARHGTAMTIADTPPRRRRAWTNTGIGLVTTLASIAVIGTLGALGVQHVQWHQTSNAVMASSIVPIIAQGEGHVVLGAPKSGDPVTRGDVIATVVDNALERDIELATLAIQDREARSTFTKKTSPIRASIDLARAELDTARSRRDMLVRHRDRLVLRAPIDGVVVDIARLDRTAVRRGDVVAEVQAPSDGTVTAFVSGADAQRLQRNGAARVRLAGAADSIAGRIVRMETVAPQAARAGNQSIARPLVPVGARTGDVQVRVVVAIDTPATATAPGRAGEPVVVLLEKSAGRTWRERLTLATATLARVGIGAVRPDPDATHERSASDPRSPAQIAASFGRP